MWFKKKEEKDKSWVKVPDRISDLEESIKNIKENSQKRESELSEEVEKLHRIIKYASDKPTFKFDRHRICVWMTVSYRNTLYIYNEKEEYIIELNELDVVGEIDEESYDFKIDGDLAYFNLSTYSKYNLWTRREYVIDFKNGSYVCNTKPDEERNVKEREKESNADGRPLED